jgi:hypothetical protein
MKAMDEGFIVDHTHGGTAVASWVARALLRASGSA